jgi:DNA-nicking Smr family endonuclease
MLTDDDLQVWNALTRDVKPLGTEKHALPAPMEVAPVVRPRVVDAAPFVAPAVDRFIPGVDRKVTLEIKRGKLPVEAQIDLHGMTIHQAHIRVNAFLLECSRAGKKKVMVITGKGGEKSIRQEFPHWVQQEPLRGIVISCTHAHFRQGGSGAFALILRAR